jgi:hypothetical protein
VLTEYRIGYGIVLFCYNLRDATAHRKEPSRATTFRASMEPSKFELITLATSLTFTIGMLLCVLGSDKVSFLIFLFEKGFLVPSSANTDFLGRLRKTKRKQQTPVQ